jgi:HlyD family secretion protein
MSKSVKIIIGIVVLFLIGLVAGSKMGWFGKKGNFKEVITQKIELTKIVETVSATGKIYPEIEVSISSEVSGEILELPFKEGDPVKKGTCWSK